MSRTAAELDAAFAPLRDHVLTPALVIDLDAVSHNIATMIQVAGAAHRWRPHIKTVKQAAILERLAAQGIDQLKCATLDELELGLQTAQANHRLARCDILLAYPLYGSAFARFVGLQRAYASAKLAILADSPQHLLQLAAACQHHRVDRLAVYLDVDLGMHRTGQSPSSWIDAQSQLMALPSIAIVGLHGYDGHIHRDERAAAFRGYDELCQLARRWDWSACGTEPTLLTAGTHSFSHALAHDELWQGPWRTQITPGTVLFSDTRSQAAVAPLPLQPAAFVVTRVISQQHDGVTLDAGTKAIAPDVPDKQRCIVLDAPQWQAGRANEEHLRLHRVVETTADPELGALLWLIPAHVCTTVNLHRHVLYLAGDRMIGEGVVATGHPLWLEGSRLPRLPLAGLRPLLD